MTPKDAVKSILGNHLSLFRLHCRPAESGYTKVLWLQGGHPTRGWRLLRLPPIPRHHLSADPPAKHGNNERVWIDSPPPPH